MTECLCPEISLESINNSVEFKLDKISAGGVRETFNTTSKPWIGDVDENGTLVPYTGDMNLIFNGVKKLSTTVLKKKFYANSMIKSAVFPDLEEINCVGAFEETFANNSSGEQCGVESIAFPKLKTLSYNNAFLTMCKYNSNLKSISFDNLETIDCDGAFSYAFFHCYGIESVSFPKLVSVNGDGAFRVTFAATNIKSASFPALKEINGDGCFYQCFSTARSLENVYFPELERVGDYGLEIAFRYSIIKNLSFPKLKTLGVEGFAINSSNGFETVNMPELERIETWGLDGGLCYSNLVDVVFPKLSYIGYEGFRGCFEGCESLQSVSFPSFGPECASLPDSTDSSIPYAERTGWFFNNMLSDCSNVVVHFRQDIEEYVSDRSYFLNGFGGTNTTILYDLPAE